MNRKRPALILLVTACLLTACSSNGSDKTASTATQPPTSAEPATTTTVVQREQVVPATTKYMVDGRSVDLVCKGKGTIPVVFQAGGRAPGSVWNPLINKLGPNVFTCVYDRPGVVYANYQATPKEQLTPRVVEDTLAKTLAQAKVGPRVILVSHSAAGLGSIVFGADHPELVAGAVLFDPTSLVDFHPFDREEWTDIGLDIDAALSQVQSVKSWPDVPLAVLSADPATQTAAAGWTAADRASWSAEAKRYAALSPQGTRRVVAGSKHHVYLDAPEESVAAIKEVLGQAS